MFTLMIPTAGGHQYTRIRYCGKRLLWFWDINRNLVQQLLRHLRASELRKRTIRLQQANVQKEIQVRRTDPQIIVLSLSTMEDAEAKVARILGDDALHPPKEWDVEKKSVNRFFAHD